MPASESASYAFTRRWSRRASLTLLVKPCHTVSRRRRAPDPDGLPPEASLGDLLEEIAGERGRTRGPYEPEVPWVEPTVRRVGLPLAGCLVRIPGLIFLLIVAAIMFVFLLFGGFVVG